MVAVKGMAHFSIAVSDVATSTKFYTEIVGCKHLMTTPDKKMAFIDAGGDCLILVKHEPPINRRVSANGAFSKSRSKARPPEIPSST